MQRLLGAPPEIVKLFEIADRLGEVHEQLVQQTPVGKLYDIPFTATTDGIQITIMFAATIYNDGDADIYLLETNRNISPQDVPIKTGENFAVDFRKRGQYSYVVKTLSGTATGRIKALQ